MLDFSFGQVSKTNSETNSETNKNEVDNIIIKMYLDVAILSLYSGANKNNYDIDKYSFEYLQTRMDLKRNIKDFISKMPINEHKQSFRKYPQNKVDFNSKAINDTVADFINNASIDNFYFTVKYTENELYYYLIPDLSIEKETHFIELMNKDKMLIKNLFEGDKKSNNLFFDLFDNFYRRRFNLKKIDSIESLLNHDKNQSQESEDTEMLEVIKKLYYEEIEVESLDRRVKNKFLDFSFRNCPKSVHNILYFDEVNKGSTRVTLEYYLDRIYNGMNKGKTSSSTNQIVNNKKQDYDLSLEQKINYSQKNEPYINKQTSSSTNQIVNNKKQDYDLSLKQKINYSQKNKPYIDKQTSNNVYQYNNRLNTEEKNDDLELNQKSQSPYFQKNINSVHFHHQNKYLKLNKNIKKSGNLYQIKSEKIDYDKINYKIDKPKSIY